MRVKRHRGFHLIRGGLYMAALSLVFANHGASQVGAENQSPSVPRCVQAVAYLSSPVAYRLDLVTRVLRDRHPGVSREVAQQGERTRLFVGGLADKLPTLNDGRKGHDAVLRCRAADSRSAPFTIQRQVYSSEVLTFEKWLAGPSWTARTVEGVYDYDAANQCMQVRSLREGRVLHDLGFVADPIPFGARRARGLGSAFTWVWDDTHAQYTLRPMNSTSDVVSGYDLRLSRHGLVDAMRYVQGDVSILALIHYDSVREEDQFVSITPTEVLRVVCSGTAVRTQLARLSDVTFGWQDPRTFLSLPQETRGMDFRGGTIVEFGGRHGWPRAVSRLTVISQE